MLPPSYGLSYSTTGSKSKCTKNPSSHFKTSSLPKSLDISLSKDFFFFCQAGRKYEVILLTPFSFFTPSYLFFFSNNLRNTFSQFTNSLAFLIKLLLCMRVELFKSIFWFWFHASPENLLPQAHQLSYPDHSLYSIPHKMTLIISSPPHVRRSGQPRTEWGS